MDWLKKFFSDPTTLGVIGSSALIGLLMGGAQGYIQKKYGGWPAFFTAWLTGVAVAVLVGLGIKDYVQSEAARLAIVAAAAIISEDVWAGLRAIGRLIREDPLGAVSRLIDALRGKPAAAKD